jgi:cell division protein FtsL
VLRLDNQHSPRGIWRPSERGEGKFKAILVTLIIAVGVYVAFKIVPAYVNNYQLKDKMQEIARFSVVNHETEEQVRDQVFKEIDDLRLPVRREDIKVTALQKRVTIEVDYTIPVDLQVYQTELHFANNADNASLF